MIAFLIRWSIANRLFILLATFALAGWGYYALRNMPVDAIPDLSDVQVIIKTSYAGQAPQVVEDQVTYPLTTAMLSVPKATTVRGYSFFGDSFVYVIFEDDTDLYWARSRVLEYLSQVAGRLPANATPELGPDATGVGWIYNYALVDRSGQHDLAQLRSLQDWFLKFELQTVPGVAEIATVGGMVRQYQVTVDPDKLRAYEIPLAHISTAIRRANQEAGASVIEMAEAEYMVRASGYLQSVEDIENIPLGLSQRGAPLLLGAIAEVGVGPQMRRGIAELDGEGEVVGGVVVMRYGENAQRTIEGVKKKLQQLEKSLPDGVELVTTYDRSRLISRATSNIYWTLVEEFLVVTVICAIFLFHFRSALVVIFSLPVGILVAFAVMHQQGLNANIMSLGGIAIAIGAMVDGAIVMIENVHKHLEREDDAAQDRWRSVADAAAEVGPPLFFSLLIIAISFLPVFTLQAQEGKLFTPLAFTKTYAMAAAAGLAVTLVPVLMGYCIRGKIKSECANPLNTFISALYRPVIEAASGNPKTVLLAALVVLVVGLWPASRIGSEFMPPLDEGDLLYMPNAYAGISIGKARQILQQTDKLIRTVPEVETVFGKIGRAETATDPAPLTMIETVIQLKPRELWRPGMTAQKLRDELNSLIDFPGLANIWVMPIRNRIDMLATGIKTPVGVKVAGPDLTIIQEIGQQLEKVLPQLAGTVSVYSERVAGGRYIKVDIDRRRAARYNLNIDDVQAVVRTAIGGMNVTETVEGLERYPVSLRYPQSYRNSAEQLKLLPIITPNNERIALADVARIYVSDGPPALKSENARLNGWTFIDISDRDLGSYVEEAQRLVAAEVELPPGYSLNWSGEYEYMLRAKKRLKAVIPLTLTIIAVLLFLNFRSMIEVAIIMGTVPFALIGGIWLMYLLNYEFSVAVGVGFVALAGVAVEIGILMLVYLNQSYEQMLSTLNNVSDKPTRAQVKTAVLEGAARRVRPIMMTFSATVAGLVPIMVGSGTGSEVMQRIAGPMVGGMLSTLVLTLIVLPVIYLLWKTRGLDA
ncbi:MAG: efflux RND transporter permease subunit [Pseudomonadales bacterium]